jgi:hypothetical protein
MNGEVKISLFVIKQSDIKERGRSGDIAQPFLTSALGYMGGQLHAPTVLPLREVPGSVRRPRDSQI